MPTFSLGRLHLWMFVAATLAALLTSLPGTVYSAGVAIVVVVVFLVSDLRTPEVTRCTGLLAVSYYACALALAVAAAFAILVLFPPPKPPRPLLVSILYVVSGNWMNLLLDEVAEAAVRVVLYFLAFASLTLVSFALALFGWRKHPIAKWIAISNSPGVLLTVYVLGTIVIDEFSKP